MNSATPSIPALHNPNPSRKNVLLFGDGDAISFRIEAPIPPNGWYFRIVTVIVWNDSQVSLYCVWITIIGVQTNPGSAVDWESLAVTQLMSAPSYNVPTVKFILYCGRTAVASSLQPYDKFGSSASPTWIYGQMNLTDFIRLKSQALQFDYHEFET